MNFFAEINQNYDTKCIRTKVVVMDVDNISQAYEKIRALFSSKNVPYELLSLENFDIKLVAPKSKQKGDNHIAFKASIYELIDEVPSKDLQSEEPEQKSRFVVVVDEDVLKAAIAEYNPTSVILSISEILVIANASRSFKFE